MDLEIIDRLAALEQQVSEFLPAALERKRGALEPCDWLMGDIRAKVEFDRGEVPMSVVEMADVYIDGDIDDAMALKVHDRLEAARLAPAIRVHIDSQGGDYDAAIRIYRSIRWHTGITHAKLGKRCMSAGVLVSMACDHRVASPDTQYMLHLTADCPDPRDRWTMYRHIEAARRLRQTDSLYLNVVADRSGADLAALTIEAAKDQQQPLEWCLTHGLIHEIEAAK